ncbi:MAG: alanine:cation symporter family protein, partial [Oscillospiraceae bacterium]|nr:alanine:cation symporter family protein [Oscillospiraceae bacterium]
GGFAGSALMYGIKRGLFSNEAGMGSAPNATASSYVTHPVKQGLTQVVSVFIDTILICSTSAFIILLSGTQTAGRQPMAIVQSAFTSQFGQLGLFVITISIFFFSFSSIIGNYFYTESNLIFIYRKKSSFFIFRLSIVFCVLVGSTASNDFAWNIADILMGIMTVINITAITFLHDIPIKALKDYRAQKKAGKNPVFNAEDIGIHNTYVWNNKPY